MASFKELRNLPPPDLEKLAAFLAGFSERFANHEARFRREAKALEEGDRNLDRTYDI